jgi:hypothetical protein
MVLSLYLVDALNIQLFPFTRSSNVAFYQRIIQLTYPFKYEL